MNERIWVFGEHGSMEVDRLTGDVLRFPGDGDSYGDELGSYDGVRIIRFDMDEYRRYWGDQDGGVDTDILCIGYWYSDRDGGEHYEPAVDEFRQQVRNH